MATFSRSNSRKDAIQCACTSLAPRNHGEVERENSGCQKTSISWAVFTVELHDGILGAHELSVSVHDSFPGLADDEMLLFKHYVHDARTDSVYHRPRPYSFTSLTKSDPDSLSLSLSVSLSLIRVSVSAQKLQI
jgi:hypothetical protein